MEILERVIKDRLEDIKTLPFVTRKLMIVLNDPHSSARDLAVILSRDPALSSRVLKFINSAYYGFPQGISTVQQAVTLMGFNVLRALTMCVTSFDEFFRAPSRADFDRKSLWVHSLGVAIVSREIAKKRQVSGYEDFFIAGLIHDIGKVILDQYAPEYFMEIIAASKKYGIPMYQAEKTIIHTTHAEVGKWAAEKWKFPELLIQTILYHHNPLPAGRFMEPAVIVSAGNYFCKANHIGKNGDESTPTASKLVKSYLPSKRSEREKLLRKIKEEVKTIEAFFDREKVLAPI